MVDMSRTRRRHGRDARTTAFVAFGQVGATVADKAVPVLTLIAGLLAVLGFGFLPYDYADERRAKTLQAHGTPVTVTVVEAHVDHEYAKGGGWWEVDGLRVRIPAVGDDQWVELTGLGAPELDDGDWTQGWQELPAGTGYDLPLSVRYTVDADGQVNAMTESDIAFWADSGDWKISLGVGVGGLVMLLIGIRLVIRLDLDW